MSNFEKGREYCKNLINADLLDDIFRKITEMKIRLEIKWMPSHLGDPNCKKEVPQDLKEPEVQAEQTHTHTISITTPRFPFHVVTGFPSEFSLIF